jgi:hypothetical protein
LSIRSGVYLQNYFGGDILSGGKGESVGDVVSAAALLGARGGKATADRRSAEQRSEAARKAVQARWDKARAGNVEGAERPKKRETARTAASRNKISKKAKK